MTEILYTERLKLVPLQAEHAFEMYDGYCEPKIYEFIGGDIPESKEWLYELFKKISMGEIISRKGVRLKLFDWVIYEKTSGEVIGRSEFTIYPDGSCNVAYVLFKQYWGKGFATEATRKTLNYIKEKKVVNKFIIACDTYNFSSEKIAIKLGFEFVRIEKEATQLKNKMGDDKIYEWITY